MGSPLQQQSLQRKLIYLGLIVVLFFVAFLFRRYGVEAYAQQLSLREQDRADVELTGSAVQLTLTGSRGIVVCVLWYWATDKQRKNQWNELELLVRSVTKLQPHFITPWLFQSWNLAYNVSVESDRERDQYFYISRGIELLGEGERQNKNNPEMRSGIAHYTMNKVAQGDKKNVLMSLFNMSCIDPRERTPARFRAVMPDGVERSLEQSRQYVKGLDDYCRKNPSEQQARDRLTDARTRLNAIEENFRKFCADYPQLVRRLRDRLRCDSPDKVVDFLARNEKLPSLYQEIQPDREETPLKTDPGQRFPLLPPPRDNPWDPSALHHGSNIKEYVEYIDAFLVAHAWYSYAQEALPKPDPKIPGKDGPVVDRTKQRRPKMTTLIFRMFPARAMTYVAERLEQEGWFDAKGWEIGELETNRGDRWFPEKVNPVGTRYDWGEWFWGKAARMWQRHGDDNHLIVTANAESELKNKADRFRQEMRIPEGERVRNVRREDLPEELRECYDAYEFLAEKDYSERLTNFRHFYFTSLVEERPETVQARKLFYEADRLRRRARYDAALARYEEAIPKWKELLNTNPNFQQDDQVQEETYEVQLKYLDLVKTVRGEGIKRGLTEATLRGQAATAAGLQSLPALLLSAKLLTQPRLLPDLALAGPFDGNAKNGQPFVKQSVRDTVRNRQPAARLGR
jgi:hypothetical protein